jgi:hypothetical protein
MTDKRVYRQPLRQEWADALLDKITVRAPPEELAEGFETVQEMVELARILMSKAVAHARRVIDEHPLTEVVAEAAAKEAGKRGHATLAVDDNGTVMLEVHYGEKPVTTKRPPEKKAKWSSKLPTLDELREEAAELDVDISDLGRKKKLIVARIEDARAGRPHPSTLSEAPAPPKPKRQKRAQALTPAKVVTLTPEGTVEVPETQKVKAKTLRDLDEQGPAPPDEPEEIPLETVEDLEAQLAEPPELELEGDDETPTDEAAIEAAVEAKSDQKVDMKALLNRAEDLDIDSILAKLDGDAGD